MKNKPEAVETEAEELLFYSDKERDAALGTIGHFRIDFGRSGEEFNCTWFDMQTAGKMTATSKRVSICLSTTSAREC